MVLGMPFDILDRTLNVFTPHFLEASAGTGKTFAIEHLFTRLLIEGETPFIVEQILVVTFTRAAARELKWRIRKNLVRAKEELQSSQPSFDYLAAVCEKGDAAIQLAVEKLDAALICFDAAQIYTLHGFCHRLLNEFALEANVHLELADPDEQTHRGLLEQCVRDYLKTAVSAPNYSPVQVKLLLKRYQHDPKKLISALTELVSSNKEIASFPTHADFLQAFVQAMSLFPVIEAEALKADIELLKSQYKKMTDEELNPQIALLCAILERKQCTIEEFDELIKKECFLAKMGEDNLKVRAKMPASTALRYPGIIEQLRQQILPYLEQARDPQRIFLRLAREIQEHCQTLLEKMEHFTPDALLVKVQQALEKTEFIESVRQKYRAVIIDEFQDTDSIQWNICQKLFVSHLDVVCLVGDPKQSIYAFRNADVYTYLAASKAMEGTAKKHLDTNYRSTPHLVEALNALFAKAGSGWMTLPMRDEQLEVLPVKAGSRTPWEEKSAPIQFFVGSSKKGKSKRFPTKELFEKNIFPFIASEIFALRAKATEYHDIAILVKDRYQAEELINYLKQVGIPSAFKRGAPITSSFAYFALKELLTAVLAPDDLSKLKIALGGPLVAWTEAQLRNTLKDSSLLQAKAKMQILHDLLVQKGFGFFFPAFLNTSWDEREGSLLESLLNRGDLSLYLDLRKLAELLIEEEMLNGLKAEDFLSFLEAISTDFAQNEGRFRIPAQEEQGSVIVMTIHMSKGLEFDTVFALGLSSRHPLADTISVKKNGRSLATLFDVTDPICQLAVAEADAEKMRQLYVALTRAKKRLYIPLIFDEDHKEIEYGEAAPIELFFTRMLEPKASHTELYQRAQTLDAAVIQPLLDSLAPKVSYRLLDEASPVIGLDNKSASWELSCPSPLALAIYPEQLSSFTSLAKKDPHLVEGIPFKEGPLSIHTLPLGSQTGHLLHLLLEKIFKKGLHHLQDEQGIFTLIEQHLAHSPLQPWQPLFFPWIRELLTQPLNGFALCALSRQQFQQEMGFFFPIANGMMKGFADLCFEWAGRYYLLDWKSNYLGHCDEDYTQESMAKAMALNQYDLQAGIYAAALKRFVKLFDKRPFSECFGGAFYYFIRGKAVYHFIPNLFEDDHAGI
jgi:exodeoxyribonuclease V beta subunit